MVETTVQTVHLMRFLYTTKMMSLITPLTPKFITLIFTALQQQQGETTSHCCLCCSLNVQKVLGFES